MYETQILSRLFGQTCRVVKYSALAQVVHGLVAQTSFPGPFPGDEVARLEERLTIGHLTYTRQEPVRANGKGLTEF